MTAFITGASSGIGAAFARRLAAQGYDLVLTARRADRLAALADELRTAHGIAVAIFPADLATDAGLAAVADRLRAEADLALLINNAGFGTLGFFADEALDGQLAMLKVHVEAPMRLTHAALPLLRARRGGAVINVSSIAAFWPAPGSATYSATKAYLTVFSEAIQTELKGTGVQIQALCPGFTDTEFHDTPVFAAFDRNLVPRLLWLSAEVVVEASLAALATDRVIVIPGFKNRLLVALGKTRLGAAARRAVRRRRRARSTD